MKSGLFEWDDNKAARNMKDHRVSFEEALTVFADPLYRAYEDPDHSKEENRYIAIGESLDAGRSVQISQIRIERKSFLQRANHFAGGDREKDGARSRRPSHF